MILYTMMPEELVFPHENELANKYHSIEENGVPLLVSQNSEGEYKIVRLLSSDPQHYLDNRYIPGTKISFQQR